MRVHLGCDHAGYEFKTMLAEYLRTAGHDVVDHGAHEYDADDDYPAFCIEAAEDVVAEPGSLGIVIGGSGNGEQIVANKVPGVRAALAWSVQTAQLAREHNDANVLGLGARMHSTAESFAIVQAFLETPFSGEPRHQRRIDQVAAYEAQRDGAGA
ncbi:MAG: ribose-5-phosphate isomerase [Candidatus Nanopelagicales bacterium]|jgi:ribose 5-phosphate isomerase B|nr:ribose-5-phosphate isomerase [Candidatus Nanopelagicales bacterium]